LQLRGMANYLARPTRQKRMMAMNGRLHDVSGRECYVDQGNPAPAANNSKTPISSPKPPPGGRGGEKNQAAFFLPEKPGAHPHPPLVVFLCHPSFPERCPGHHDLHGGIGDRWP
jgi:hypothetical protein